MLIENTEVFGLERAIRASGYPMQRDDYSEKRASRLGRCAPGTGHDCFLKGIVVMADVTAPQYWWMQFDRYHFWKDNGRINDPLHDIVSSQSKMHRILKMDIAEQCNEYVWEEIVDMLKKAIEFYNSIDAPPHTKRAFFQGIISNCPMGLRLKAAITTNYLQVKSTYFQRQGHKLEEWEYFCNWAEGLPKFKELVDISTWEAKTNEPEA